MLDIPDDALFRVSQICNLRAVAEREGGNGHRSRPARSAQRGLIPVSPSCWWRWVSTGFAPAPRKLGGATVWSGADLKQFIAERLSAKEAA